MIAEAISFSVTLGAFASLRETLLTAISSLPASLTQKQALQVDAICDQHVQVGLGK